jgi:hypothetical protein
MCVAVLHKLVRLELSGCLSQYVVPSHPLQIISILYFDNSEVLLEYFPATGQTIFRTESLDNYEHLYSALFN